jgi:hypothetical protein
VLQTTVNQVGGHYLDAYSMTVSNGVVCIALRNGEAAMKTIASILVALSVLVGAVGSANAFDGKRFWEEHPTSGQR